MVFKIQIPLATNVPIPQALIYNQTRSIEFLCPAESVAEWFIEDSYKIYVDADYATSCNPEKKDKLIIHKIVLDEDW